MLHNMMNLENINLSKRRQSKKGHTLYEHEMFSIGKSIETEI